MPKVFSCCLVIMLFIALSSHAYANNEPSVKVYGTHNDSAGTVYMGTDPQTGDTVISVQAPKNNMQSQQYMPIYIYPQVEMPHGNGYTDHPAHLGPGPHTPVAPIPPSPYEPMPIERGNP